MLSNNSQKFEVSVQDFAVLPTCNLEAQIVLPLVVRTTQPSRVHVRVKLGRLRRNNSRALNSCGATSHFAEGASLQHGLAFASTGLTSIACPLFVQDSLRAGGDTWHNTARQERLS